MKISGIGNVYAQNVAQRNVSRQQTFGWITDWRDKDYAPGTPEWNADERREKEERASAKAELNRLYESLASAKRRLRNAEEQGMSHAYERLNKEIDWLHGKIDFYGRLSRGQK